MQISWNNPFYDSKHFQSEEEKTGLGNWLKTKYWDMLIFSYAPPFYHPQMGQRMEWDVEGSVEWKERTSKWWERERSGTVALANVFPGCSHSNQSPDLWCCIWQTTEKKKKKKKKENYEEPSLAISRKLQSLCGYKQWARTGSHSVPTSEVLWGMLMLASQFLEKYIVVKCVKY